MTTRLKISANIKFSALKTGLLYCFSDKLNTDSLNPHRQLKFFCGIPYKPCITDNSATGALFQFNSIIFFNLIDYFLHSLRNNCIDSITFVVFRFCILLFLKAE
jgi:hypothetical protein